LEEPLKNPWGTLLGESPLPKLSHKRVLELTPPGLKKPPKAFWNPYKIP